MKLKEIRDDYEELTGKVSELNRKCIYAGIAVIWLFRISTPTDTTIPEQLREALFYLVMSLGIDVFQYILLGGFWYLYYQCKKNHLATEVDNVEDEDVNEPEFVNNLTMLPWFGKIVLTIMGYIQIAYFLHLI